MGDPKCIPAFPGHLEAANKRINQLNSNQTEPPADKTPAQLAHSSSASSSVERMRAISMMSSMMLITPSSLVEHLEEGPQRALLHRHRPVRLPQRAQQLVDGAVGLGLLGLVDQQPLELLLHQLLREDRRLRLLRRRRRRRIVGSVSGDELDLGVTPVARCREGARTVPSPRIHSFIRKFDSPARPPVGGDRSQGHPGIHLGSPEWHESGPE